MIVTVETGNPTLVKSDEVCRLTLNVSSCSTVKSSLMGMVIHWVVGRVEGKNERYLCPTGP